ncbi:MAG: hypothetical protein WKH64_02600 [Chloroflexia bacterium]
MPLERARFLDLPRLVEAAFAAAGVAVPDDEFGRRVVQSYPLIVAYDGLERLDNGAHGGEAAAVAATFAQADGASCFIAGCQVDAFPAYRPLFARADVLAVQPLNGEEVAEALSRRALGQVARRLCADPRVLRSTTTVGALAALVEELERSRPPHEYVGSLLLATFRRLLYSCRDSRRSDEAAAPLDLKTMLQLPAALAFRPVRVRVRRPAHPGTLDHRRRAGRRGRRRARTQVAAPFRNCRDSTQPRSCVSGRRRARPLRRIRTSTPRGVRRLAR